jgi:hypothetical protein
MLGVVGTPVIPALGRLKQEDCSSKPARANSSQDPISKKNPLQKGLVEWLKVKALSSSPSTSKKKSKQTTTKTR